MTSTKKWTQVFATGLVVFGFTGPALAVPTNNLLLQPGAMWKLVNSSYSITENGKPLAVAKSCSGNFGVLTPVGVPSDDHVQFYTGLCAIGISFVFKIAQGNLEWVDPNAAGNPVGHYTQDEVSFHIVEKGILQTGTTFSQDIRFKASAKSANDFVFSASNSSDSVDSSGQQTHLEISVNGELVPQ